MCFSKQKDTNWLCVEFSRSLKEQNEDYLDYKKNEEESIFEEILLIKKENYYANLFEDVKNERSLILLLPIINPDIKKHTRFTDIKKN